MKRRVKILSVLLTLTAFSSVSSFAYFKYVRNTNKEKGLASVKSKIIYPLPEVLGDYFQADYTESTSDSGKPKSSELTETLLGTNSKNIPETITKETEKIVREAVSNVTQNVRESVVNNVQINQEKIVQDVTAKLLQNILTSASGTAKPVDKAVIEACLNIINKSTNTTP